MDRHRRARRTGLVREYAAAGWTLVTTARRPADAADLKALAAAHPGRISIETLDVLDHASIDALAAKYQGRPIDILINNAGITGNRFQQVPGKFDYAEFRQVFETNVVAPLKIADTFLPQVQASRVIAVTTKATLEDTGKFSDYRGGELPW